MNNEELEEEIAMLKSQVEQLKAERKPEGDEKQGPVRKTKSVLIVSCIMLSGLINIVDAAMSLARGNKLMYLVSLILALIMFVLLYYKKK